MRLLTCLAMFLWVGVAFAQGEKRLVSPREADAEEHKVYRIHFNHIPSKRILNKKLRAAMQTREGQVFQRRLFLNDLRILENLYRSEGYMGMEILGKKLEMDEKGRLHIFFKIDSKEQWTVADVRLDLAVASDTTALWQQLKLLPGQPFRYGELVQGERELQTFLNRQGYAHAKVAHQLELDPVAGTASVVYHIDPGQRMYLGRISIVGSRGEKEDQLHTRPELVRRYLSFEEGDLYDPEELRRSRSNLAHTDLFRSVTLSTPAAMRTDSLQPVEIRLQEKKYIHLGANFLLNNTEPRIAGNVQHSNWLGRGIRLGLDASLGQPVQGATLYLSERGLLDSDADLTLLAGLTEEWGNTQRFANPADSLQFELLTTNDTVVENLLLFGGEATAIDYLLKAEYDFASIERLWKLDSTLARSWKRGTATTYSADFSVAWTRSATRAMGDHITYTTPPSEAFQDGGEPVEGEDPFPDDPFPDDPFPDDPFPDDDSGESKGLDEIPSVDYSDGQIPLDEVWKEILTEKSRALNFELGIERDTRDNQIAPSRGSYLRLEGLYAIQLGGQETRILDGEFEVRHYRPLGKHLVWAQAVRLVQIASLRQDRALPRAYWKELGGDGSVRGVKRNAILAVDGGRTGINLRNELRLRYRDFGLVLFWDRAQVWRRTQEVKWRGMVDGYGLGLRYTIGIPFRLDLAFNDGFDRRQDYRIYFSIGQAF